MEVPFRVFLRIAKAKKPHTVTEELILPCAKDIDQIIIVTEAENKLNLPPLSDNTMQRRIMMMSEDVKDHVIDEMKSAGSFAL